MDELYWNGSPFGGFTLSSALKIIRNEAEPDIEEVKGWKTMWRVEVPQRIKFFLWLASQDRLMTNSNRFIRQLTSDPRCLVCGEVEEHTLNILRDCPTARVVWRKLGMASMNPSWNGSLKEWILHNIEAGIHENNEGWPQVFSVAVWWLWKWCNDQIFNENPRMPLDQVCFIMARVHQVKVALTSGMMGGLSRNNAREEIHIRWCYPCLGWVRLNTDGASKGNPGKDGAGGLIRWHRGELFEVFATNCGVCSSTKAELLGVLRGLCVAWNGGHHQVVVSVDSEIVVNLLGGDPPTNSPYIHIIRKCQALLKEREWKVTLEHSYREANKAADWLANYNTNI